jgi:UrcA family protein
MTRTLFASALLTFASAASATSATAPIQVIAHNPPTARITYDDLDLKSGDGVHRLQRRIHRAAQRICAEAGAPEGVVDPMADQTECYMRAVASGLSQLNQIASQ